MKYLVLAVTIFCFSFTGLQAQTKLPALDKSPMDISYYPNRYPVLKIQDKVTDPLMARVVYSRPQKNGRVVFGNLIEYGKVWRLGANEATEIEFFGDVKIGDTKIKKGRYTMYAIPNEDKWTIIINKDTDTWGSFKYDEKNDVVRVDIPVQKQTEIKEEFVMAFEKSDTGADLIIAWENVKLNLPIAF
ncbi:MAG: DUF2911 domain-containing protein [Ferruginibacter sp.]